MLFPILLFLLLNTYAALSGLKDTGYFSGKAGAAFKFDPHRLFSAERATVFLISLVSTRVEFLASGFVLASWLLTFSMAHNTAYYYGRHLIDPTQPADLTYSSSTSTAKLEFNFKQRLGLAIAGVVLLILSETVFT